jgi:hypothetical protein
MGGKKPKFDKGIEPDSAKRPVVDPALKGNAWPHKPLWKLGKLDLDGRWGWRAISPAELEQVLQRIRSFESMTWAEIERKTGRSGSHCHAMEPDRLCSEAQERLTKLRLDEITELYSMRCDGAARIWGYRTGHVFHVLWWDRDHTVYPMDKAN